MKKKTLKAFGIAFLGLLLFVGIVYISIAFIKAELNPFIWSEAIRALAIFITCIYLAFAPLIVNELKD